MPKPLTSDRKVSRTTGYQGGGDGHRSQVRGHGRGVSEESERVVVQEDYVASAAGCHRALAIGARSQGSGVVRERAGFQGSRSAAERCTAAAMASHRSSGAIGASDRITSRTPASIIDRNGKQRSARSGQHRW